MAVRRLTEAQGVGLAEVRRVLTSGGDAEPLREQVHRLFESLSSSSGELAAVARRLSALENRVEALEAAPPRRRRWLSREKL